MNFSAIFNQFINYSNPKILMDQDLSLLSYNGDMSDIKSCIKTGKLKAFRETHIQNNIDHIS